MSKYLKTYCGINLDLISLWIYVQYYRFPYLQARIQGIDRYIAYLLLDILYSTLQLITQLQKNKRKIYKHLQHTYGASSSEPHFSSYKDTL